MADESESLLSPELMDELGGDASDLIVAKKSKKDKRKRSEEPSEEVKLLAKKMSKTEQKRVNQIKQRKEKEAKRADYLQIINENSLTDEQRMLMTSSNNIGQTQTMKQLLSSILRKQKAGITLTEEERELLYKSNDNDSVQFDDIVFPTPPVDEKPVEPAINVVPTAPPKQESLLFSFDSLQTSVEPSKDNIKKVTAVETSKKTMKNKVDTKSDNKNSGSGSGVKVGTNLLAQLAALKKTKATAAVQATEDSDSDEDAPALVPFSSKHTTTYEYYNSGNAQKAQAEKHEEDHSLDRYLEGKGVYKPSEVVLPINEVTSTIIQDPSVASELTLATSKRSNRVTFSVNRPAEVASTRMQLPVCSMEQEIMEAVINNDVVILCGETGSGKSTQVPQFLYEGGYAKDNRLIGITQPRRVAVTSTANRVAYEMGAMDKEGNYISQQQRDSGKKVNKKGLDTTDGCLVGYQIRFDSTTVGNETKIKFMTDGILLREITHDLMLRQYNVIILDEAHERNINTDVLLGLISRTLPLRRAQHAVELKKWNTLSEENKVKYEPPLEPLKLIIMSATLRVTDFQNPRLFPSPPPIIQVEARQYPVTTHFSKKTELRNYLQVCHKKVCQIHRKLPEGGVLLFLTGKREILYMCHKLNKSLNKGAKKTTSVTPNLTGTGVAPNKINNPSAKKVDEAFVTLGSNEEDIEGEGADDNVGSQQYNDELEHDINTNEKKHKKINKEIEKVFDVEAFYRQYSTLGGDEEQQDEIETDLEENDNESDDEVEDKPDEIEKIEAKNPTQSVVTEGGELSVREQMLREALKSGQVVEPTDENISSPSVIPITAGTVTVTEETPVEPLKALILPLYAMMPPAIQARIFAAVPPGYRLIVVATNVAETSITIPNIRYVVDSGRHKEKVQYNSGAIAKYEVRFISKASADQRKGRSGRTGPGHCYRLYSSNYYHTYMPLFQPPEITCTPLEDLILQMKAIGIDKIESFPFPTAPPSIAIRNALSLLTYLGAVMTATTAIDGQNSKQILAKLDAAIAAAEGKVAAIEDTRGLTTLGQRLVKFPISPRYAKMLVLAQENPQLLPYVLTLVSTLTERSVFTYDEQSVNDFAEKKNDSDEDSDASDGLDSDDEAALKRSEKENLVRKRFLAHHSHGDAMARLKAAGAYMFTISEHLKAQNSENKAIQAAMAKASEEELALIQHKQLRFQLRNKSNGSIASVEALCQAQHLHQPALQSIMELRGQLHDICEGMYSTSNKKDKYLPIPLAPPTLQDETILRQILLRGYCDSIAKLVPLKVINEGSHLKQTTAYYSCNPDITQPLYLHPTSNLYDRNHEHLPKYVIYSTLIQNKKGDTTYMTCNTVIDERWISTFAEDCPLLTFSAPLASPMPFYDASSDTVMCYVTPTFGARNWMLPSVQRPLYEYSLKALYPGLDTSDGKEVSASVVTALTKMENSVPIGYKKVDEVYRWFARLLLEGTIRLYVFNDPTLDATFRKMLTDIKSRGVAAAITQLKPDTKISNILSKLIGKEIRNVASLKLQLKIEPTFLSEEIQAFLPIGSRSDFRKAWARINTK